MQLNNTITCHRPNQNLPQKQLVEVKSTQTNLPTVIEVMIKKFKIFRIQEMLLLMTMVLLINIEQTGLKRNLKMNGKIMKVFNLEQIW